MICSQKLGACRLRVGRDPIDKLTTAGGATNRYPGNFYRFGRFARLGSCLLRCLAALAPLALLASLGACPVWPRKGDDRGQQWQAEPRAGPSRARTGTFLHGLIIARRGQRAAHTSAPTLTRPQVGLWVRSYAAVAWAALFTSRSPNNQLTQTRGDRAGSAAMQVVDRRACGQSNTRPGGIHRQLRRAPTQQHQGRPVWLSSLVFCHSVLRGTGLAIDSVIPNAHSIRRLRRGLVA